LDDPGGYLITFPFQLWLSESGSAINTYFGIGLIVFLLICTALVSAAEVAFFSLSSSILETAKDSYAKSKVVSLLDKPKKLLATILLMSNMLNIGVIIVSNDLMRHIHFGDTPGWLRFLIQVVAVSFIIILFGEVIPKVYARRFGLNISLFFSQPMIIFVKLLGPFTWPLTQFSKIIDKRVKQQEKGLSAENLSDAIELASNENGDAEGHKILQGIAQFGSLDVTVIMTPRGDVTMVDRDIPFNELLQSILENGYSRIPVFREDSDHIEGILFIKDIIPYLHSAADFEWQTLVRKPFFVPENKKIDDLLKEFQSMKMHMALVVNEFGGFQGIVTLEDIIEEIVGEINDEYDDDDVDYFKMNDSNYIFAGKTSIHDFLRIIDFDLNFLEEFENDFESIAGIILEVSGRIPARNETVSYKKLTFRILNSDNRRINRVKVSIMPENKESETGPSLGSTFPVLLLLGFLASFLFSCGSDTDVIPRPKGYCEVTFPAKEYQRYDSLCPFTFEYPVYSKIRPFTRDLSKTCWFDVVFPKYAATLHLSYEDVSNNFAKYSEDQHELAYKHTSKANAIEEIFVEAPQDKVWGIVYNIEGDAASNYQFHVTDSQRHFLRGSLYFDIKANADSVAPVLNFLKKDVMHLVETVKWK
jgi:putative hemolysin